LKWSTSIISRPSGRARRAALPLDLQRLVEQAPVADLGQRVGVDSRVSCSFSRCSSIALSSSVMSWNAPSRRTGRPSSQIATPWVRTQRVALGGHQRKLEVPGRPFARTGLDRGVDRRPPFGGVVGERFLESRRGAGLELEDANDLLGPVDAHRRQVELPAADVGDLAGATQHLGRAVHLRLVLLAPAEVHVGPGHAHRHVIEVALDDLAAAEQPDPVAVLVA
jgi:hypothetical protein